MSEPAAVSRAALDLTYVLCESPPPLRVPRGVVNDPPIDSTPGLNRRRILLPRARARLPHAEPDPPERESPTALTSRAGPTLNVPGQNAACICRADGVDARAGVPGDVGGADGVRGLQPRPQAHVPRGAAHRCAPPLSPPPAHDVVSYAPSLPRHGQPSWATGTASRRRTASGWATSRASSSFTFLFATGSCPPASGSSIGRGTSSSSRLSSHGRSRSHTRGASNPRPGIS